MMNITVDEVPTQVTTDRLTLRSYAPGDGPRLFAASQKNRTHLQRYEADNELMELDSQEEAEKAAQELAAAWVGRRFFFLGGFEKRTGEFMVQSISARLIGSCRNSR